MKKVLSIFSTLALSFMSFAVLAPGVAHAAAPYTCTWTGATNTSFNTAGNWSGCNSAAPVPGDGDNLVFNEGASRATLNNDITGLTLGSITFQGSNTGGFTINGNALSVGGGISAANGINIFGAALTLTASQTFALSGGSLLELDTLNLGANNLTANITQTSAGLNVGNVFSGSGNITINDSAIGSFAQSGLTIGTSSASTYSGTITANAGAHLMISLTNGDSIGTGAVVIASGAQLDISSANNTASFPNAVTVAGTGIGGFGAITSCLGLGQGCQENNVNTTLTLSGAVKLTGDTQVANANYFPTQTSPPANTATFVFSAVTTNGHTLIAVANSNTVMNATYTDVPASSGTKVKTPDTGFGVMTDQPLVVLAGTVLVGGVFLALARGKRKPAHGRR